MPSGSGVASTYEYPTNNPASVLHALGDSRLRHARNARWAKGASRGRSVPSIPVRDPESVGRRRRRKGWKTVRRAHGHDARESGDRNQRGTYRRPRPRRARADSAGRPRDRLKPRYRAARPDRPPRAPDAGPFAKRGSHRLPRPVLRAEEYVRWVHNATGHGVKLHLCNRGTARRDQFGDVARACKLPGLS